MKDGRDWTFEELRRALGCPQAVDFRLRYVFIDDHGHLVRRESLVAVLEGDDVPLRPSGQKDGR